MEESSVHKKKVLLNWTILGERGGTGHILDGLMIFPKLTGRAPMGSLLAKTESAIRFTNYLERNLTKFIV